MCPDNGTTSARTVSSGANTCYSPHTGYSDCWNGCCGPEDDQDCCSSTELILGLALGGGAVLLVVLLVVFCWACKDCRPKPHCCGGARPRHRGGGRGGHHRSRRSRRVVVHPGKSKLQALVYDIVQELCESRGGPLGLSVLTSLLVSVDVKIY